MENRNIAWGFTAPARFAALSRRVQDRRDAAAQAHGWASSPSVNAGLLHFLGEVEVVFGLWAVVLLAVITVYAGWPSAERYFNNGVDYTEPLFVVVIMALVLLVRPAGLFGKEK